MFRFRHIYNHMYVRTRVPKVSLRAGCAVRCAACGRLRAAGGGGGGAGRLKKVYCIHT